MSMGSVTRVAPLYDSARRSLYKALSWRVVALTITTLVVWIAAGELAFAATIGALDTLAKIALYYLHERAWNRVKVGRMPAPDYEI
jgi:adenylylsulfate kinase